MNDPLAIPNGDELITLQLTVKEAMALSGGYRFRPESKLALSARRKVRNALEGKLLPERLPERDRRTWS